MPVYDYIAAVTALAVGLVVIVRRKSMAAVAVSQHEKVHGGRYDPRSFELGFAAAGAFFIAWALFVLTTLLFYR